MPSEANQDRFSRLYRKRPSANRRKPMRSAMAVCAALLLTVGIIAAGPPIFSGLQTQGASIGAAEEGKSEEEIKADLAAKVEEGMMNVSMASTVTVDADMTARIDAVNIAQNHLDQKLTITAEDGTELFTSPVISPGEGIETARFAGSVPDGRSMATAVFTGYDPATRQAAGSIALEITLDKKGTTDE